MVGSTVFRLSCTISGTAKSSGRKFGAGECEGARSTDRKREELAKLERQATLHLQLMVKENAHKVCRKDQDSDDGRIPT
jgi:hypothetical protein